MFPWVSRKDHYPVHGDAPREYHPSLKSYASPYSKTRSPVLDAASSSTESGGQLETDLWQAAFRDSEEQARLVPLIPISTNQKPAEDSYHVAARIASDDRAPLDNTLQEKYVEDRLLYGYECSWSENARKKYLYGGGGDEKRPFASASSSVFTSYLDEPSFPLPPGNFSSEKRDQREKLRHVDLQTRMPQPTAEKPKHEPRTAAKETRSRPFTADAHSPYSKKRPRRKKKRSRKSKVGQRSQSKKMQGIKGTRSQKLLFEANQERIRAQQYPSTIALGKRVPSPIGASKRIRSPKLGTPAAREKFASPKHTPLSSDISALSRNIAALRKDLRIFETRQKDSSLSPSVAPTPNVIPTPRIARLENELADERRLLQERVSEANGIKRQLESTALNADDIIERLRAEHQTRMKSVKQELEGAISSKISEICLLKQDLKREYAARVTAQRELQDLKFQIKCGDFAPSESALQERFDADCWFMLWDAARGRYYYYNEKTGESRREPPLFAESSYQGMSVETFWEARKRDKLPPELNSAVKIQSGFRSMVARRNFREAAARRALEESGSTEEWSCWVDPASGYPYYYNSNTGASTWERPDNFKGIIQSPVKARRLNGADREAAAAVTIQKYQRRRSAQLERDQMKSDTETEKHAAAAAITIQKHQRRKSAHLKLENMRMEQEKKDQAAIIIQKYSRRKTIKKKAYISRMGGALKSLKKKAAVTLQKHMRRKTAQNALKAKRRQKVAAMKIQSHRRRSVAVKELKQRKEEKVKRERAMNEAAMIIQKNSRRRISRVRFNLAKQDNTMHTYVGSKAATDAASIDAGLTPVSSVVTAPLSIRSAVSIMDEEDPFADMLGNMSNEFDLSDSFYVHADEIGIEKNNKKKQTLKQRRGSMVSLSIDPVAYGQEPEREIILSAPTAAADEEKPKQNASEVKPVEASQEGMLWKLMNSRATPSGRKVGEWEERVDANSGEVYYYNKVTDESRWEAPKDFHRRAGDGVKPDTAASWEQFSAPNGHDLYWYNWTTGETSWEPPPTIKENAVYDPQDSSATVLKAAPAAQKKVALPSTPKASHIHRSMRLWEVMRNTSSTVEIKGDWTKLKEDNSGQIYFMSASSGEYQWEEPKEWSVDEAMTKGGSAKPGGAAFAMSFGAVAVAAHTGVKMKGKATSSISRRNWSCIVSPGERCLFEFNWSTGEVKKSLNLSALQVRKERRLLLLSTVAQNGKADAAGERHLWNILHSRSIGTGIHNSDWAEMLDERSGELFYYRQKTGDWKWEKPAGFQEYRSPVRRLSKTRSSKESVPTPVSPWKKVQSLEGGTVYWYNRLTGESRWDCPDELVAIQRAVKKSTSEPKGGSKMASPIHRVKSSDFSIRVGAANGVSAILSPKGRKLFEFAPSPKNRRAGSSGQWHNV